MLYSKSYDLNKKTPSWYFFGFSENNKSVVKICFCNAVEKVVVFSRQKTLPWKKVWKNLRKMANMEKTKKLYQNRLPLPNSINPNLMPIGEGFGFVLFLDGL